MTSSTSSSSSSPSAARKEKIRDVVIRIAGNSQDGIQTIGNFLARLASRSSQDVMTYMTIPATISGGPSIFQVHMGSGDVLSPGDMADFLVAFYEHSYQNHKDSLREGGVLLYDSDQFKPDLEDKRFMYVGVPITGLTIESSGGAGSDKGKNIFVLGLMAKIFSLNIEVLKKQIKEKFGNKGEGVLAKAFNAFDAGFAYPVDNLMDRYFLFETPEASKDGVPLVTMDGNQAIAYGLIAAGVRYGAAYPITPWSSVMEILRAELPKYGGMFIQTEDEIAAVCTALGFSFAGHLGVTGSSGPGLSLKMEALGWGTMAEIPLIVVNVQRAGPSTGLPTASEQGDLMQAIYGSHGDTPRVVIAPSNVEDCFYAALDAARIAREYSTPVIILSDQTLATRIEAFKEPTLDQLMVNPELDLTPRPEGYQPFDPDKMTHHAPPGTKMLGGEYPVMPGLEHGPSGHPNSNPLMRMKMVAKRREKIKKLGKALAKPEVFGAQSGDVLVVGWGSTWGPIREAVKRLLDKEESIGHLHLRFLNPLPEKLQTIFSHYRQIFVVEMNDQGLYGYGQLATLLRARYCNPSIRSITKTDGLTFKVREILNGIEQLTSKEGVSVSAYPYTD